MPSLVLKHFQPPSPSGWAAVMAQGSGGVVRCWTSGAATKRSGADGTTRFDPGTDAAQASTLHEGISPGIVDLHVGIFYLEFWKKKISLSNAPQLLQKWAMGSICIFDWPGGFRRVRKPKHRPPIQPPVLEDGESRLPKIHRIKYNTPKYSGLCI